MENNNQTNETKEGKTKTELYVQLGIIAILAVIMSFNAGKLYATSGIEGITALTTGVEIVSASEIIPKGIPAVYGTELGVNYDDVSPNNPELADATITKLSEYEDIELDDRE